MSQAPHSIHEPHSLDALTDGAFSAPTSGERVARIRDWLTKAPTTAQMQEVFKELSVKDKGAAKLLREKLDEIKRAKGHEAIAQEWTHKARALLDAAKFHTADALAWQRDAAKVGAPLSKEPLAALRVELAERVKTVEDLQHRVQVQRESAVLLAQRIEVLSTKSWRDAQAALESLQADVAHWDTQATALQADRSWGSVEVKFPPLLDSSREQLRGVWDAFCGALAQAVLASGDAHAALPAVPLWADEIRKLRGGPTEGSGRSVKPSIDPAIRLQASQNVGDALSKLEYEVGQGHGKASAGAASTLRNALKEYGRFIDSKLDTQAHSVLAAAGELEGWQRWRADQLRAELVTKAQGLLKRPEGQAIGGRKMQESLRMLREQWKQTDQGGLPNQAAWKQFDEACNEAYKVVEAWLEKIKSEALANRAQRLALIDELNAWAADNQTALHDDWKGFSRILHEFGDRWRDAGHLGEKAFAELQPLWKTAISAAAAPLEALQEESLNLRRVMIDEANALGAAPLLRIDAVKSLQQRWQAQAHRVPVDRRIEQKMWDAFRRPIDDAFARMSAAREAAASALSARDRTVLEAAKALEVANTSGNAQQIRAAMAALDAALRGQAQAMATLSAGPSAAAQDAAQAVMVAPGDPDTADPAAAGDAAPVSTEVGAPQSVVVESDSAKNTEKPAVEHMEYTPLATENIADSVMKPVVVVAPKPVRLVVAVRGDDRPGMRKTEPSLPNRGGKFADRKDGARGAPPTGREARDSRDGSGRRDGPTSGSRMGVSGGAGATGGGRDFAPGWQHSADRADAAGPRLGDVAFRAQREALEHAEYALKKLATLAHGESLTQLLGAWEHRQADQLPSTQELGGRVSPAVRNTWSLALNQAAKADAATALLRLEMAAEVPTAAQFLDARRALQLQLLTRRNDPTPGQTWGLDTGTVLASAFEPIAARRLQSALRALLKHG